VGLWGDHRGGWAGEDRDLLAVGSCRLGGRVIAEGAARRSEASFRDPCGGSACTFSEIKRTYKSVRLVIFSPSFLQAPG